MKIPAILQELMDEGVIDGVHRQLKSGKEASVYVVSASGEYRCAKVYKDMATRSFKQRALYQEGRTARGSRDRRATSRLQPVRFPSRPLTPLSPDSPRWVS